MIIFREKAQALVGERVRAVGMCYFDNTDLKVGKIYTLSRQPKHCKDPNCIEVRDHIRPKAVINSNIAALLSPLMDIGKITHAEW